MFRELRRMMWDRGPRMILKAVVATGCPVDGHALLLWWNYGEALMRSIRNAGCDTRRTTATTWCSPYVT